MAVPLVIEEMWAWVSTDTEGEGVVAAPIGNGTLTMPLVGADKERMASLQPIAQAICDAFGVGVSLVRFTNRELITNLQPKETTT